MDAIAALLARYERPVLRFGARFCRDAEESREVLQETLFSAARALPGYRGDASVGTWLCTIARRACLRLRLRRRRLAADSLEEMIEREVCAHPFDEASSDRADEEPSLRPCDLVDPAAPPDEAAFDHELAAVVDRVLEGLSASYREIVIMRDIDGLSAPEAARALGISVQAVKSRLHRARVQVRAQLATWTGGRAAEIHP
jgi:RNA polymerase sigma-70 factor (ECF subfamily)